jgi:hypothetical protein
MTAPVRIVSDGDARRQRAAITDRLRAAGWRLVARGDDGEAWAIRQGAKVMTLIWSIAREDDGGLWLHVSVSAGKRLPTWGELEWARDLVVGDAYAYAVFPPSEHWVGLNKSVGHLFAPLDGRPRLPEFSGRLGDGTPTL